MTKKTKNNIFLLSWDQNGLESVISLHEIEHAIEEQQKVRMWEILKSEDAVDTGNSAERDLNRYVNSILLRARVNPQRHYEVYTIHTTPGITAQNMRDMFENNPQASAELIRERGTKLYSNRSTTKVLIT
jgi:hypothetical protein